MDDWETVGESHGFETAGEYHDEVGQVPPAALRRFPTQQQPASRFAGMMRAAPGLPSPRAGIAAVTADQVRAIAREEIARARQSSPTVPWTSMPARATPRDEAMWPLGIGVLTFDSSSPTTLSLAVTPQRPFRGERLVLDIRRVGASAQLQAVTLSDLRVGDIPQRVGGGLLSAEVFRPDAFGVRLSLDASVPGIIITLGFTLVGAPLAVGDSITIAGAIIGRATEAADR
jgi:hypothetical protein